MTFTNLLLSCAQKSLKLAQSPIEIIYEFVGTIVTFRKRRVYELCNPLLLGMYDFLHVAIPFIGYVFVKKIQYDALVYWQFRCILGMKKNDRIIGKTTQI